MITKISLHLHELPDLCYSPVSVSECLELSHKDAAEGWSYPGTWCGSLCHRSSPQVHVIRMIVNCFQFVNDVARDLVAEVGKSHCTLQSTAARAKYIYCKLLILYSPDERKFYTFSISR